MHFRPPAAVVRALVAAFVLCGAQTAVQAADFVGSESCRSCHAQAFEQWSRSAHAKAYVSLAPAQRKEGSCLQCHAPDLAQGGEAGVSCESCHGAGQYYSPEYVMRDAELARAAGLTMPDARSCLLCHDASGPSMTPFEPAQKMKLIDHWTQSRAERAARKKARSDAAPQPEADCGRQALLAARTDGSFLTRVLTAAIRDARPPAAQPAAAPVPPAEPQVASARRGD